MADGGVINSTTDIAGELVRALGSVGLWLQAIGGVIVLWLAFQTIAWVLNRKRLKRLDKMNDRLDEIEKKLDRVLKKSK